MAEARHRVATGRRRVSGAVRTALAASRGPGILAGPAGFSTGSSAGLSAGSSGAPLSAPEGSSAHSSQRAVGGSGSSHRSGSILIRAFMIRPRAFTIRSLISTYPNWRAQQLPVHPGTKSGQRVLRVSGSEAALAMPRASARESSSAEGSTSCTTPSMTLVLATWAECTVFTVSLQCATFEGAAEPRKPDSWARRARSSAV